jgi:Flp pilus assembly protein TadD
MNAAPDYPAAWNNLGNLFLHFGHPEDAIMRFDAALSISPEDGNLHNDRAAALVDANRFDEAEASISAILRAAPDNYDALLNRDN